MNELTRRPGSPDEIPRLSATYSKPITEWNESHMQVLIEIYAKESARFLSKGLVKKKLWEEVAQKVNKETGLNLKGFHCENK